MGQTDISMMEKEKINANSPVQNESAPLAVIPKPGDPTTGLFARLGRWFDKDRGPAADDIQKLYTSRLTDVAANKLARQWWTLYEAADAKTKRALLITLAQASNQLEPRGDLGLRMFKRLYAQADSLKP